MSEGSESDDKTEEPTPERREEARERGDVVSSKEITSIAVLVASFLYLVAAFPTLFSNLRKVLQEAIIFSAKGHLSQSDMAYIAAKYWGVMLWFIVPIFGATAFSAAMSTLLQTRFNFSFKKVEPDFDRINPIKGIGRLLSGQSIMELVKGIGKITAISIVSYLVLKGEMSRMAPLLNTPITKVWTYWGNITQSLVWGVIGLLAFISAADYLYGWWMHEKQLRMSKQEIKDEYKNRESDPHMKNRMRKMAREFSMAKAVKATKEATVVITNPTHFAIALKYEIGSKQAPVVVAKGIDHNALRMREVAKEADVPIVENKALARTLYKMVEVGQEIPDSLYKAVSEVIRFVFKLRGIKVPRQQNREVRR